VVPPVVLSLPRCIVAGPLNSICLLEPWQPGSLELTKELLYVAKISLNEPRELIFGMPVPSRMNVCGQRYTE
jgi:hypothetical protein